MMTGGRDDSGLGAIAVEKADIEAEVARLRGEGELREAATLAIGSSNRLGRFRLLRRLGAGGMGIVYEALDEERDVRVAVKTLRNVDADLLYRL